MFRVLKDRIRALVGRDVVADEIREELQFHEDRLAERLEREGRSPSAARREARRRVGSRARLQDAGYDVRGGGLVEAMLQDLRHAVRRLIAQPGFTAVALVTLALGIGANTAIFSVASGVLLQPPPYPHPDRLTMVWNDNARISIREDWHSYPNYVDYRDRSTLFDGLAAFNTAAWTLTGDGDPERIPGVFSTANLFDVLGVGPERGRTYSREEDLAGATDVVVISHRFWRQRFGGSEDAVGRSIMLNRNARRIIGIMPEGFAFPSANSDLWVPAQAGPELRGSRGSLWLQIVGRRKADVTVPQAQQDLTRVNAAILAAAPGQKGYGVYVEDYREHLVGQVRPAILILLGAVACVLLIACTNVANLLVARGAARQREMALRAAIGAGRGRLVRQLLTESLLIATLGGAAGALIGWLGLRALLAAAPADLPRLQSIVIDGRVLLFTAAIALGTGIAFGLIPALQAARTDPGLALKEGGRGATGAGALARRALVVIEVAIAVVLLVAGGLMVRSYLVVQRVDLGFRTDHVLTARVSLPGARYERPEVVSSFFREFTERAGRLPNIQGAAAIGTIFLSETPNSTNFSIEGRPDFTSLEAVEVPVDSVTPDYVKVMGIRVLAGRFVTDADTSTSPAVVVINDTMARQFWPRESPLGRRIKYGSLASPGPWRTIVGIVADMRRTGFDAAVRPETYLPLAQAPDTAMTLVLRTTRDPLNAAADLRSLVRSLDPTLAVQAIQPLDAIVAEMTAQRRLNTLLLGGFAVVAALLAAIGLYGVMAHAVEQRTRELGVRLALGASGGGVMRLVIGEGLRLVLIGLGVGLTAAVLSSQLLTRLLYHVQATDPATLGTIVVMTLAVAAIACVVPALRALRVDPVTALRAD